MFIAIRLLFLKPRVWIYKFSIITSISDIRSEHLLKSRIPFVFFSSLKECSNPYSSGRKSSYALSQPSSMPFHGSYPSILFLPKKISGTLALGRMHYNTLPTNCMSWCIVTSQFLTIEPDHVQQASNNLNMHSVA